MSEPFPRHHLENLWAPWRVEYYDVKEPESGDFLTRAAQSENDADHLVVTRLNSAFLIMNKYPYSAGHLMAVPYRQVSDLAELLQDEVLELWKLSVHAQALLRKCVRAQGFNVGWNIGAASGAGVDSHLHLHIVPRWNGDANFMTVLSGARIIPEGLKPLYERLMAAQNDISVKN